MQCLPLLEVPLTPLTVNFNNNQTSNSTILCSYAISESLSKKKIFQQTYTILDDAELGSNMKIKESEI